jgi:hypothetical protein
MEFAVATAEDVIFSKLRWYRLGGEGSGQQGNDVLGVNDRSGRRCSSATGRCRERHHSLARSNKKKHGS